MKFQILLTGLFLFLCGCTTVEFVRKETAPQKQGVLRYSPPSSASSEAKYKDEVNKQATGFCGGDYTITKEYQAREDSGTSTGIGTGFGMGMGGIVIGGSSRGTSMYNFVEFVCK